MTQGILTNLCASLGAEVSSEVWPYKVPDSAIQNHSRRMFAVGFETISGDMPAGQP
jgi:hypothetical protein